jgi:hypothetical protein
MFLSFHIPQKVLATDARKQKSTMNNIMCDPPEKKSRYAKVRNHEDDEGK